MWRQQDKYQYLSPFPSAAALIDNYCWLIKKSSRPRPSCQTLVLTSWHHTRVRMPRMKLQIFARLWTMPNVFAVGVLNDTGRLLHLRHLISIITCINPPLTARNSVKISKYQKYSGHLQKYMHRYYSQIPISVQKKETNNKRSQRILLSCGKQCSICSW